MATHTLFLNRTFEKKQYVYAKYQEKYLWDYIKQNIFPKFYFSEIQRNQIYKIIDKAISRIKREIILDRGHYYYII